MQTGPCRGNFRGYKIAIKCWIKLEMHKLRKKQLKDENILLQKPTHKDFVLPCILLLFAVTKCAASSRF